MKFPEVIDNTQVKAFRRCPQYWRRRYLEGLQLRDEALSVDTHFGGCFAKGVEMARRAFFEQGKEAQEAIETGHSAAIAMWEDQPTKAAPKSAKTLANLLGALSYYWQQFPLGADGLTPIEGGIEMALQMPLPFLHPETGEALRYAGRCDLVARNEHDGVVIVDEKTMGRCTDAWLAQWDTDPQMSGYQYLLRHAGHEAHSMIRGVEISSSGPSHVLVPVFRSSWQLDNWYAQLLRDVRRMLALYKEGTFDFAFGSACTAYGRPCEFARLCTTPNAEQFVETNYFVNFWNPLAKEK